MVTHDLDDKTIITISLTKGTIKRKSNNRGDKVFIKLNDQPVWDFDFDVGAASIDLDMSKFMTRDVEIDGGAASIELKLGDKYDDTMVNIDAGASSVTVKIPMDSGCELYTSTVLSSRSISGFERISKNTYRTDNYYEADNKVEISIDAAVSSFSVLRY